MSTPAKFLFDVDFAAPKTTERQPSRAEIAQEVADAEARAFRNGFEAAQRDAKVESDRRSAMALEEINAGIRKLAQNFGDVENRMETEAVDVAMSAARKLCNELIAAEPLAELTALVAECFRHLTSTPHIVIRVNDALYERVRESVEALARRNGFAGKLVILAESDIAIADCRIEWADGGCTLDRAATQEKIDELVNRYMAARQQAGRMT